ncbi:MAG TPA: nucleoside monophosphate kinase, partial [Sedimentisphaerales bacterium]|nr:nucleoside monophosphate kinase [Sedimentisphaerales bacterium]
GAGKGTQCKNIVAGYRIQHLSSGDILRRNRSAGTDLGKKAQSYMDAGDLVPDRIIIDMMSEAIRKAQPAGFVLDGFPRTVNQARELDKSLAGDGAIDAVVNLKIDDSVVHARMTGRRSCPKCGAVYHIENLKPKTNGVCDHDGTRLVQRPDDTPEVVANRLETYHRQTEPLVDYYRKNGTVFDIEADRDPDEVKACVFEKLQTLVRL